MNALNFNNLSEDETNFLKYFDSFTTEDGFIPESKDISFFVNYANLNTISIIKDGAIYCAMIHDSFIGYMITMKSGFNTESGKQYLTGN